MYSYIGRCPNCNAIVAAVLLTDTPDRKFEVARTVKEFIEDDLVVEKAGAEVMFTECTCGHCYRLGEVEL